jgi:MFS family permease
MKKSIVSIIFLTVLIDLVGFGLILPLIPIYSENFHASGFMIGAIIGSYSLMQFIFAPIWGRLSDRVGRRPVLLGSTACACLSYVIFAIGSGLSGNVALGVMLFRGFLPESAGPTSPSPKPTSPTSPRRKSARPKWA